MAPSHYLNHCWNIVNWTLVNKLQWNFNPNSNIFIQENTFENFVCEMASICLGPSVLMKENKRNNWSWDPKDGDGMFMMTSSNGNIFRVTGPLCGEFTGPGEFPTQRPVTRSFVVYFDLCLNKRLCKQSWGWWFETLLCPLWRHSNVDYNFVWSI